MALRGSSSLSSTYSAVSISSRESIYSLTMKHERCVQHATVFESARVPTWMAVGG